MSQCPATSEDLQELNKKMGFTNTELELKSSDFLENKRLRQHYKLMLNAGLGKLAQRQKKSRSFFAKSEEEISTLTKEKGKGVITNIYGISDNICQVYTEDGSSDSNLGTLKSSSNANPVLYAFITARTRITIHKNIMLLQRNSFNVYYCDCDSILFAGNKASPVPLDVGFAFGQFRSELKKDTNIQSFVAHGRKNYKLTYKDGLETKSLFKLSGICLKSPLLSANKIFTEEVPQKADTGTKKIAQIRHVHKQKLSTTAEIQHISVRQDIICQRKVDYSKISRPTFPWGFRSIE